MSHYRDRYAPCADCGDLDGCHLWDDPPEIVTPQEAVDRGLAPVSVALAERNDAIAALEAMHCKLLADGWSRPTCDCAAFPGWSGATETHCKNCGVRVTYVSILEPS